MKPLCKCFNVLPFLFLYFTNKKQQQQNTQTQRKERKEKNGICGNCCCEGIETGFALLEQAWYQ